MKKIVNIKNIVDKYQYLNIITIVDEANDENLSIYRTCIEFSNPEIKNIFYQKALRLNKLDLFEKYENIFLNLLNKIYSIYKVMCFKYDEWPDKPDNSIEIFEINSCDEFDVLCKKGLREKYFFGFLIDEIGLIFTMNFDLSIVFFYYEVNDDIKYIESLFENAGCLVTRY